jgi:hypothetical protein
MCGVTEWHGRARQPDAKDGGANQRPAAEIKGLYKSQFGSFPQADQAVAMVPLQRHMILVITAYQKRNCTILHRPAELCCIAT